MLATVAQPGRDFTVETSLPLFDSLKILIGIHMSCAQMCYIYNKLDYYQ